MGVGEVRGAAEYRLEWKRKPTGGGGGGGGDAQGCEGTVLNREVVNPV